MNAGYDADDFARAVALVGAEPSPQALVERLGLDWDRVLWLALDASATVLGAQETGGLSPGLSPLRGRVVSYGGEAFTAGFLVGAQLPRERGETTQGDLTVAVATVQERGRHAVIADHCDLAGVGRFETVYADALVESMAVEEADRPALVAPMTRIFEAGLAVALALCSDGEDEQSAQQP